MRQIRRTIKEIGMKAKLMYKAPFFSHASVVAVLTDAAYIPGTKTLKIVLL